MIDLRKHIGAVVPGKACCAPLRGSGLDRGRRPRCRADKPIEGQAPPGRRVPHDGATASKGGDCMAAQEIPVWEKYTLTVEEASKYFRIGEGKIRRLADIVPTPDWVLMNGSRIQIKRRKFEQFIDSTDVI